MRIFSYNILDGGEGRADPLAEVIAAQRADVIALIESQDPEVLARIAKRLQMDYVPARGNSDSAVALLSRFPIRDSINHAPLHPDQLTKSLLQATIIDSANQPWHFGVIHLHHRAAEEDERVRERELDVVLKIFEELRTSSAPHILLGDFNANSPHQQIDLNRCKPSTREQAAKNGETIPRRVIQRLETAGYLDTLHSLHPAQAATEGTFTTQYAGQRVDYIFTHSLPSTRIRHAWIETHRLAKYASDHFPIGAEIA
jgi:endonuclease/exonuclease/phosphatase family metal-dependent hydrolase